MSTSPLPVIQPPLSRIYLERIQEEYKYYRSAVDDDCTALKGSDFCSLLEYIQKLGIPSRICI